MSLLSDPKGAVADLTRPEAWVLGVSVAFMLFLLGALLTGALGRRTSCSSSGSPGCTHCCPSG